MSPEDQVPSNNVGDTKAVAGLDTNPPRPRRRRRDPHQLGRDAVLKACKLTPEEKRDEEERKQASAARIEEARHRDEENKAAARNIIHKAKRHFRRRYPRIQESRILRSMREARQLLNDIQEMKQEKTREKIGRLMRYRPSHRLCLISCGPGCPAPLHEDWELLKKQPLLFYLHESKYVN
jgi:hypothetical protein